MLVTRVMFFCHHDAFQTSQFFSGGKIISEECVQAAEKAYQKGNAPLNAVEGFIRQIIGWREYVRGICWTANTTNRMSNDRKQAIQQDSAKFVSRIDDQKNF